MFQAENITFWLKINNAQPETWTENRPQHVRPWYFQ